MSLRLPWALPLRRELDPGVLLVAGSHGIPPTRTRTVRTAEIASQLAGRGVAVDVCILVERALQPMEEDAIVALRSRVRRLELVPHPRIVSRPAALANRAAGLLGRKLGGITHVPWSFVRRLATEYAPKNYRAVIVGGVHLAPCLSVFPDYSERFIDLERIGSDALREHRARGKGEDLAVFGDGKEELELLGACHAVIVTSVVDAVHLRELGFRGDIALAPPLAPARAGRASVPRSARPGSSSSAPRAKPTSMESTGSGTRSFRRARDRALGPAARGRRGGEEDRAGRRAGQDWVGGGHRNRVPRRLAGCDSTPHG
jgi:hypothetical protein